MEQGLKREDGLNISEIIIKAKVLISKQKLRKAIKILEPVLKRNVQHSDIYFMLGEAYRQLEEFIKSKYYLLECLKFEDHSHSVYRSLGLLYY